jgi:hypothetical protein
MIDTALYDAVRQQLADNGFTTDNQTRLSLLLMAAKQGNAAFHAGSAWLPMAHPAQQFLLSQSFRETEALTLLQRVTQWSSDPAIYVEAARLLAPLNTAWSSLLFSGAAVGTGPSYFRGIALGHATLARIRLTPIVPNNLDMLDPYLVAVTRIEQENSRLLQTQIRLLKHLGDQIPLGDRESLIDEAQLLVDGVFSQFLNWLAKS